MACPFGVLTYAPSFQAPERAAVALKCDQCPDREAAGAVPACVAACKVVALTYGDWEQTQEDKGRSVAQAFFASLTGTEQAGAALPATIRLWRQLG